MNVVQASKFSTSLLARTVIERDYLRVGYLAALLAERTPDGQPFARGGSADDLAAAVTDAPARSPTSGSTGRKGCPMTRRCSRSLISLA